MNHTLGDYFPDIDADFGTKSLLAKCNEPHHCYLEITINHPQTADYKRLTYDNKVDLIVSKLNHMLANLSHSIAHIKYSIEHYSGEGGLPHLHAQVHLILDRQGDINGLVTDVAIRYIRTLSWRYEKEHSQVWKYLHIEYNRYRCPSCVVQYKERDDIERIEHWDRYISKYTNPISHPVLI